ncbi:MAG: hypothetical protein ACI9BF_000088 [Candidatus Paceibacteria bacterium]|jgi:hypothetical protein
MFKNPLGLDSVKALLESILDVIMIISTPIVVFLLIYAGFMYVTARGNPEQIGQATRALTYGVIGGVVIMGSAVILNIMSDVATSF